MDEKKIKEKIKTRNDIQDDKQDGVIDDIIDTVQNHMKALLGKETPSGLEYIVKEISIIRFNRIGSEGMKSESVEGHSVTYNSLDDDFAPYMSIIISERGDDSTRQGRGKVMFI